MDQGRVKQQNAITSTMSYGGYLHWMSHYAQNPLSAIAGYLDMLGERQYKAQQQEIVSSTRHAAARTQALLSSIELAHRYMGADLDVIASRVDTLFTHLASHTGARLAVKRIRPLPLVLVHYDALRDGLAQLVSELTKVAQKTVRTQFTQRGQDVRLSLYWDKAKIEKFELLKGLAALSYDRYPLVPGEQIPVAAAFVALRASGARIVVRQHDGAWGVHVHLLVATQLSLVDIQPHLL